VWATKRVRGWRGTDGEDTPESPLAVHPLTLAEVAFGERYATDAHAVGYAVRGADGVARASLPRINVEALATLISDGDEPLQRWVFVDVDNPRHEKWASKDHGARTVRDMFARFGTKGGPLDAAGWYTTTNGFRLVWRLECPIKVSFYNAWAEAFLAHLSKRTGIPLCVPKGRANASPDGQGGIDVTCAQWSRCFRLPFVRREVDGADGRPDPARAYDTDPAIDLSRVFEGGALYWSPPGNVRRDVPAPAVGDLVGGDAPPYTDASDITPEEWAKLEAKGTPYYHKIRDGLPLSGKGDRDQGMMRAIGDVVGAFDTTDPTIPWRFLARCVAADVSPGAPTLPKLWDRCKYVARRQANQHAVAKIVERVPPIVFTQASTPYYVWNEATGGYEPPVKGVALVHGLDAYCPTLGIVTRTQTGKLRDAAELIAQYGAPARRVIVEYGRALTTYDRRTATVYEAAAPPREVAPVYHAQVDRWLGLLAGGEGANAELLRDWLATVRDVQRPTCALYVEGKKSVGKGMLAQGIASLWSPSASPVDFVDVVGAFNGAITSCPLVFADESMPQDGNFSATFRRWVGNSTHRLSRKFLDVATLIGCPRFLIAANNGEALRLKERLTAEDLDAIVERILYLPASPEAAEYLEDIGGREYTTKAGWVLQSSDGGTTLDQPGKIAEHIAYLEQTRNVKPGPRFLVHGRIAEFHRDLTLTSGLTQSVLSAIAKHVDNAQTPLPGIIVGARYVDPVDGVERPAVWVNAEALTRSWVQLHGTQAPPEHEVSATLKAAARGRERHRAPGIGQRWYHVIPGSSVLRVAELLQIGDAERIERRLDAGIAADARPPAPARQGAQ
jgi:hypothetical protein